MTFYSLGSNMKHKKSRRLELNSITYACHSRITYIHTLHVEQQKYRDKVG